MKLMLRVRALRRRVYRMPSSRKRRPGPPRETRYANHADEGEVNGFTLLELLVVIVVIAVLATLVAPNVFRHLGAAKDATARTQIELLGAALDAHRLDTGRYPTSEQGLDALWSRPMHEPLSPNWKGPYLRKEVPTDPWDRAYVYRSPGTESGTGYDLLSSGADGKAGGEGDDADILSWKGK